MPSPPASPSLSPEVAKLEAEMEANTARARALDPVIHEEQRRVVELIQRHKGAWKGDLERHLADQAAVYRSAIVAMEQAREELVGMVQLGGWLDVFPATGGQVPTHQLPGAPDTPLTSGPVFREVLAALLRDSVQLPWRGPIGAAIKEYMRAMSRKQLVFEQVDRDGIAHPVALEGDTAAGWRVRDWLQREFKQ